MRSERFELVKFRDPRLPERFWEKAREDSSGCWIWVRAKSSGYGKIEWCGRSAYAHVVAYSQLVGDIPDGLVVDHECHVPETCRGGSVCKHRACVNPAHLEVKTNEENTSRGRVSHANSHKSHCPKGHEYAEANTRRDKHGNRFCRACERERSAARFDAYKSNRQTPVIKHRVTHCTSGHEYTPRNSGVNASGSRYCLTCRRESNRAAYTEWRSRNPIEPKTHCPQGHEYTPENTHVSRGARKCRECARIRAKANRDAARQVR